MTPTRLVRTAVALVIAGTLATTAGVILLTVGPEATGDIDGHDRRMLAERLDTLRSARGDRDPALARFDALARAFDAGASDPIRLRVNPALARLLAAREGERGSGTASGDVESALADLDVALRAPGDEAVPSWVLGLAPAGILMTVGAFAALSMASRRYLEECRRIAAIVGACPSSADDARLAGVVKEALYAARLKAAVAERPKANDGALPAHPAVPGRMLVPAPASSPTPHDAVLPPLAVPERLFESPSDTTDAALLKS